MFLYHECFYMQKNNIKSIIIIIIVIIKYLFTAGTNNNLDE